MSKIVVLLYDLGIKSHGHFEEWFYLKNFFMVSFNSCMDYIFNPLIYCNNLALFEDGFLQHVSPFLKMSLLLPIFPKFSDCPFPEIKIIFLRFSLKGLSTTWISFNFKELEN